MVIGKDKTSTFNLFYDANYSLIYTVVIQEGVNQ
jgi:hypothetical protein